jgi:CIC family chloride channel protein
VVGGLVLLALERLFPGEVLGYGFPRFLEMLHLHGARVKRRWMFLKTIGAAVSLGAGASVGREGPIAQIGGAIGMFVAGAARLAVDDRRVLVACGAAAGIAATFDAPVAGVLFAQEIVFLGETRLAHLTLVVVAAAVAVATTREVIGVAPVLHAAPFALRNYLDCLTYAALGLVLGLIAVAYVRAFYAAARTVRRLAWPRSRVLLLGLAVVGLVTVGVPENFSDGYPIIDRALASALPWPRLLLLAVTKFGASIVSLACGAPGGVFGPIFFVGAMFGGAYRALSVIVAPSLTGPAGSYALVGLAGFLAATTHAPLTAMFLVVEMTGSYGVTVPALITVGMAVLVAQRFEPESIDTYGLHEEGKHLRETSLPRLLARLPVGDDFRPDVPHVPARATLPEVLAVASSAPGGSLPVVDDDDRLVGVLSWRALRHVLLEADTVGSLVIAADLAETTVPVVTPETSLVEAFRRLEATALDAIPVVDPEEPRVVLGMLSRGDLIAASGRAASSRETPSLGSSGEGWREGTGVVSVPVPPTWVGRSLRELDARQRHGVSVLAVRAAQDGERSWSVPDPDRRLAPGDVLLLAGPADRVRAAREAS